MNEDIRDPREDISYIKTILARTADGMRSVAPWFKGFGVLWLCYGLLSAVLSVLILHLPMPWVMTLSQGGAALGWLFYIALAVGFVISRRRQAAQGLDTLALKLVDTWGVCIVLFLILTVLLNVIVILAVRVLGFSMEAVNALGTACSLVRSFLFFLLPAAPLLMTAQFLENRRMLWWGVALAVLGVLFLGCHILLVYAEGLAVSTGLVMASTAVACLINIAPGGLLLLFARALKRA